MVEIVPPGTTPVQPVDQPESALIGKYRGYVIYYDPPPIPIRSCDWHFVHKDYEGGYYDAEGAVCEGDPRHGHAASAQACRDEIDFIEDAF